MEGHQPNYGFLFQACLIYCFVEPALNALQTAFFFQAGGIAVSQASEPLCVTLDVPGPDIRYLPYGVGIMVVELWYWDYVIGIIVVWCLALTSGALPTHATSPVHPKP